MSYPVCPKCNYARRPEDDAAADLCPACGVVFSKWRKYYAPPDAPDVPKVAIRIYSDDGPSRWQDYLLGDSETDSLAWSGRLALFVALAVWGGWFCLQSPKDVLEIGNSFLHGVNLVFHEAGHVIFMPFGDFMHILGGSLGQVLMPLIVMGTFLYQRNPFGAAVGLWWASQSLMDVSIYIDDARALQLPLLGGGTGYDDPGRHDWNNLLSRLGLLTWDHGLAGFTYLLGRLGITTALAWCGALLLRQHRALRHRPL